MKQLSLLVAMGFQLVLICNASAQMGSQPSPRLYPNKHLSMVGETKANQDIRECSDKGAVYIHNSQQSGQGARNVVRGAARGALLGTVGGAVGGDTGKGAAVGASLGATGSLVKGAQQRGSANPAFQQYVTACLEDKGYKVLEWR